MAILAVIVPRSGARKNRQRRQINAQNIKAKYKSTGDNRNSCQLLTEHFLCAVKLAVADYVIDQLH